ncbi:hypothetical protein B0T17DRAFT_519392, partial [Bombardia bombarda]
MHTAVVYICDFCVFRFLDGLLLFIIQLCICSARVANQIVSEGGQVERLTACVVVSPYFLISLFPCVSAF